MAESKSGKKKTTASRARTGSTAKKSGTRKTTARSPKAASNRGGKAASGASAGRGRNQSAKRSTSAARQQTVDYAMGYEIALWCLLGASAFAFFSMLGFGGKFGGAVSALCLGAFGIMGFLFPFAAFFIIAFLVANGSSRAAKKKMTGLALLFISLCMLMQMIMVNSSELYSAADFYEAGSVYHTGGGVVGGSIVKFFVGKIGVAGLWIILMICIILSLLLLTQRSLMDQFSRGGRHVVRSAKVNHAQHAAWREERRTQRQEQRLREELEEPELAEDRNYDPDELAGFSIIPAAKSLERRLARRVEAASEREEKDAGKKQTRRTAGEPSPRTASAIDFSVETEEDSEENLMISDEPKAMNSLRKKMKDAGEERKKKKKADAIPVEKRTSLQEAREEEPQRLEPQRAEAQKEEPQEDIFRRAIKTAGMDEQQSVEQAEESTGKPEPQQTAETAETAETHRAARKTHVPKEELEKEVSEVASQIEQAEAVERPAYQYPSVELLSKPSKGQKGLTEDDLRETAEKLEQVFDTFGVNVHITNVSCGPSVTRYELTPEMGVKVSKIVNLQDDIKLNLAAADIRIEAPIPGKAAVGIEVPNKHTTGVALRELLESEEFKSHPSKLAYAVGKDISGKIIVSDIAKMPHLLIAGSTGSGKSVFINTLIMSILYKASPEEVQLIMIDPKVVELSVYNGIPHLYIPVVTDPKKAAGALNWAVSEMMGRYQKFADNGCRDLKGYNKKIDMLGDVGDAEKPKKLPHIVIIVDELADLMMVASAEVEDAICRLAQLARAAGIHLVIATQRPSVDVITGLIKANMPSRIAFSVSSGVDSRTILDSNGAEKLLGNGDMLFAPQTFKQPLRVQGAFVSDGEVAEVTDFLKSQGVISSEDYAKEMEQRMDTVAKVSNAASGGGSGDVDELFADAGRLIIGKDKASKGMIQRYFKVGFNRAARIMDELGDAGVVGPDEGTKPRKVLMSAEEFENYLEQH